MKDIWGINKKRKVKPVVGLWKPIIAKQRVVRPIVKKGLVSSWFSDKDRDGVANIFDCRPNNKRKQGYLFRKEIKQTLHELQKAHPKGKTISYSKKQFLEGARALNKGERSWKNTERKFRGKMSKVYRQIPLNLSAPIRNLKVYRKEPIPADELRNYSQAKKIISEKELVHVFEKNPDLFAKLKKLQVPIRTSTPEEAIDEDSLAPMLTFYKGNKKAGLKGHRGTYSYDQPIYEPIYGPSKILHHQIVVSALLEKKKPTIEVIRHELGHAEQNAQDPALYSLLESSDKESQAEYAALFEPTAREIAHLEGEQIETLKKLPFDEPISKHAEVTPLPEITYEETKDKIDESIDLNDEGQGPNIV